MGDSLRWKDGIGAYLSGISYAGEERSDYAKAIRHKMDSCCQAGIPVIVCGDMNDVSGSKTLRTLQEGELMKDAWWESGCGFGFTYRGHRFMRFRLDHVLYSSHIESKSIKVVEQQFSDHNPIVTEFEWN